MKNIYAEIITIGDEILYGQIVDTNSQWISAELDKTGIKTIRKTTVADVEEGIIQAFAEAETRADIVLITGGLGPTSDDLTKPALAKYFDSPISINQQALKELTALFESRGFKLNELNRQQASLPEKCKMISNKIGTAAGMWFEKEGKVFVSMPGVPHEMKKMMHEIILPELKKLFNIPVIFHKIVKTVGIGESWLSEKVQAWEQNLPPHIKLAYLPGLGQVKLRLTASGSNLNLLISDVDRELNSLKPLIEKYIFGYDNDTLEENVGKLLLAGHNSLALAESCTGGYISHALTSVPGSSRYFRGSLVPYHNDLKINMLGVKAETIEKYGAVSEEAVSEMANRAREIFDADIGISSSGVAGPEGGSTEKPVGTVWIATANDTQTLTKKLSLTSDRIINIKLTSVNVLNLLRRSLLKKN